MTDRKRITCSALIKADTPTPNGNIYPREVVEKMIEDLDTSFVFVSKEPGKALSTLGESLGRVEKMELDENGNVTVEILPFGENMLSEGMTLNSTTQVDPDKDIEEQEDGTWLIKKAKLISFSVK